MCKAIIVSTPTDVKTDYVWLRFFVVAWARIYNKKIKTLLIPIFIHF